MLLVLLKHVYYLGTKDRLAMQLYPKKMHIYSLMHFSYLESKHSGFHMHMYIYTALHFSKV